MNVFDYITWRGDLTFGASPFNEVDNLIFAMLTFIDYHGIAPETLLGTPVKLSDCLRDFDERNPHGEDFGPIIPSQTNDLFRQAARSTRFSDVYVTYFKNEISEEEQVQFSAVTFILPDNSLFIAFRGTDDTLIGWREDFNLSFTCPVPAQEMAAAYLADIASVYSGGIRLGGHSKGGNLSVYAAAFCPEHVRSRIINTYSNDGPGFLPEIIESDGYRAISDKVVTLVPQSSVVGMLLEHDGEYHVIESTIKNGIFQHDPFSWSIVGPSFVHLKQLSKQGELHNRVIRSWLAKLSADDRRRFTETFFGILESSGAKTVSDLADGGLEGFMALLRSIGKTDKQSKDLMVEFFRRLAEARIEYRET